jgi:hypothetical protein
MPFYTPSDPFRNETELLKQIALFQRKAAALDDDNSSHRHGMRDLYLGIITQCRNDLSALGNPCDIRGPAFQRA